MNPLYKYQAVPDFWGKLKRTLNVYEHLSNEKKQEKKREQQSIYSF